ncbi:hypothetical protein [Paludisphaera soli]|uniref:hypothetical protein n=1 Tax=Paludisphaera soli TaxID=2712865 RepID=UPI0013E9F1AB|nr:hypothetical protein [Paludisphaera soli]
MRIHGVSLLGIGAAVLLAAAVAGPEARAQSDAQNAAIIMNGVGNLLGGIGDAARGINGTPENVFIRNGSYVNGGYPGYAPPFVNYQPPPYYPQGQQVIYYQSGYQGYAQPQPMYQQPQYQYAPQPVYQQPQYQYVQPQQAPVYQQPQYQYVQPQQAPAYQPQANLIVYPG